MISPGASWIAGIGYIRQANDAPLNISPRNRDQYVAAVRHSRDFVSARKVRADNSRLLQSARRASSIARALRACTSAISSSISGPLDTQYDRQRDHHIAIGHQQVTCSNIATRLTASSDKQIRRASSRACRSKAPPSTPLKRQRARLGLKKRTTVPS